MKFTFDKILGFAKVFHDDPTLTTEKINATFKIHAIELIDGLSLRVGDPIIVGNYPQDNIHAFDVWQDTRSKKVFIRGITEEYAKTGIESFDRLNIIRFPAEKVIAIWNK